MKMHFTGIAGVGMSNLARLALSAGHQLTGSDRKHSRVIDELLDAGANQILLQQTGLLVADADVLVRSVAIPNDNPDLLSARENDIPVWTRMQCIAHLLQERSIIAVAGSFGKSTTATLLADILTGSCADPTVYVGAKIPTLNSGVRWGQGPFAVVEACEYRREILHVKPQHLIITNLAVNHEDEFGHDLKQITTMFNAYIQANSGRLETLWLADDDAGSYFLRTEGLRNVQTWGTPTSDWFTDSCQNADGSQSIQLFYRRRKIGVFKTCWIGPHIARNLTPVLGMAKLLGLQQDTIENALLASRPLPRRYDIVFGTPNLEVVDDNARLPHQIKVTLAAARLRAGTKGHVIAVLGIWGTLNRRNLAEYASAVSICDDVYVLSSTLYEAGQGGLEPMHADALLVDMIQYNGVRGHCFNTPADIAASVSHHHQRAVLLTLGYDSFSDIFQAIHRELQTVTST